jgi:hypothetical protein
MIESSQDKLAYYYSIKPTQFSALKQLTFSQSLGANGGMEQSLSIILARDHDDLEQCLYLDFYGVKRLELKQPETSHIVLSAIEIMLGCDVPNVYENYVVRDPEQSRILWFECRDFQAVVG